MQASYRKSQLSTSNKALLSQRIIEENVWLTTIEQCYM